MLAGLAIARAAAARRTRAPRDAGCVIAVAVFVALLALALFGGRLAPYEAIYFVVEHGADPRPYEPGVVFPFGSDLLGRDLLSLVLVGARTTLAIVLLAGAARVIAGLVLVALSGRARLLRAAIDSLADIVGALPATLVAVLLIRGLVRTDTTVPVLIGAVLLTGWAGPYRVVRAEADRIRRAPFTEGARAVGMTGRRLFWRHQLPHLAPTLVTNLSQQIVASLVLVAELGVLGILVSPVRTIDIEESLRVVRTGVVNKAAIPDLPEWGAMLASSRTVEALWLTRWVIFVPGAMFALTAGAVALGGFALARRWSRHDILGDRAGIFVVGALALALTLASTTVPERYADARSWADAARAAVVLGADTPGADWSAPGLETSTVSRSVSRVVRAGAADVSIGSSSVSEAGPGGAQAHVRSLVTEDTGGGVVDAPLVFVGRGIVPADHPPLSAFERFRQRLTGPDLGALLQNYPNDYAGIDVRGKVVVLTRFLGIDAGPAGFVAGLPVENSIQGALRRGAAAIVFVDPFFADVGRTLPGQTRGGPNAYENWEQEFPARHTDGVPTVIIDTASAAALLEPLGINVDRYLAYDPSASPAGYGSVELTGSARVSVPLRRDTSSTPSLLAQVPGIADDVPHVVVWATRELEAGSLDAARTRVLAALARFSVSRKLPFVFVDFDAHADTEAVREALAARRVTLVVVLQHLDREVLTFATANGDLIPAFDLYAVRAGAHSVVTRLTASIDFVREPLAGIRTIAISSVGSSGDAASDAAAVIGYLGGRLALGAPEVPR